LLKEETEENDGITYFYSAYYRACALFDISICEKSNIWQRGKVWQLSVTKTLSDECRDEKTARKVSINNFLAFPGSAGILTCLVRARCPCSRNIKKIIAHHLSP
jgi:hypothetical protein